MAVPADATWHQVEYHGRRSRSSLSGGVRLSMVTEHRSRPPSFWSPRPSTPPPQDTSDNPVFPSAGAAMRARAVQQTLIDPGLHPNEEHKSPPHTRSRVFHSLPPTPTSDTSASPSQTMPRSPTSPTGVRSSGHLNAQAHTFVPGRPVDPMPDVVLKDYIKLSASACQSSPRLQPSGTPLPTENWTPSDEEDAETQWREQTGAQVGASPSVVYSAYSTPQSGSPELVLKMDEASCAAQEQWVSKVAPLVQTPTLSPFARALSQAKNVDNLATVPYPTGTKRVRHNLRYITQGGFRYDRDFLLQFMTVCTGQPASFYQAHVESLNILATPGSHPPLSGIPMSKKRPKQGGPRSDTARAAGLAFGSADVVAGSDDVRIAPSALPFTQKHHIPPLERTRSVASDCTAAPISPTVVGPMSESGSATTLGSPIDPKPPVAGHDKVYEQYREARIDELERKVTTLSRVVESLREEVGRLQALHSPW